MKRGPWRLGPRASLSLLVSLRPEQWTKNLIVFAALIFARRLFDPAAVGLLTGGLFDFLRAVRRRLSDQRRLRSRGRSAASAEARRPIASGELVGRRGAGRGGGHRRAALAAAFWLQPAFGWIAAAYLALFVAYSRLLKHVVILDVLTIAIGFVLRAAAGGW